MTPLLSSAPGAPQSLALGLALLGLVVAGLDRTDRLRDDPRLVWFAFAVAVAGALFAAGFFFAAPAVAVSLQGGFAADGCAAFFQIAICVSLAFSIVLAAYGGAERPGAFCGWALAASGCAVLCTGADTTGCAVAAIVATGAGVAAIVRPGLSWKTLVGPGIALALAVAGLLLIAQVAEAVGDTARLDRLALAPDAGTPLLGLACGCLTAAGVFGVLGGARIGADSATPASLTAWLAVPTIAAVDLTLRLRLGLSVFDAGLEDSFGAGWGTVLGVTGGALALVASAVACRQSSLKGVASWFGAAQAGWLMLALAGSVSSPQSGGWVLGISGAAVAFVTLSLILTQLALLSIAVMAEAELGESSLRLLRGLGRRNPWLMAFLAFGLASAVGLPATLGFAGVLQAIRSALEASHVLAVGLALVAMPVALAAALRVLRVTLYETIPEPDMSEPLVTSSGLTIVCAAFAGAVVWLGVCPAGLVDFTQQLQLLAG